MPSDLSSLAYGGSFPARLQQLLATKPSSPQADRALRTPGRYQTSLDIRLSVSSWSQLTLGYPRGVIFTFQGGLIVLSCAPGASLTSWPGRIGAKIRTFWSCIRLRQLKLVPSAAFPRSAELILVLSATFPSTACMVEIKKIF